MGTKIKFDRKIYTKEWLHEQIFVKNLTRKQISKIINCTPQTVTQILKENNLSMSSRKPSLKLKYGNENPRFGIKVSDSTKNKLKESNTIFDRKIYTKEWLYNEYYVNGLSAASISKLIGSSRPFITRLMKEYDIQARTQIESYNLNASSYKPPPIKKGKENPSWKGGITSLRKQIRECVNSDAWRKSILVRDNYTCVCCGKKPKKLEVDHIKPFAIILFGNNISSLKQALECEELWNIDNGRTLCTKCHSDTDTYGHGTKKLLDELRASKSSSDNNNLAP